ncbi:MULTISPECIES: RNA polymerase sigma factor [Nonlabens]|uniref:RNA polymerase subunit sigma-70 n=1 Tax=Nonlabens agnitus TaxID=870484 RepID=A0A2S9WS44_9FLAO|nr:MULTISPECIES: sigma-70 family RNA polymerase sigma factor [Nonlabens]KQC33440.1 RNA polymerase sigma-70 factor [Nonlabens sp. YIK11]PRP66312.1 RNA polymerase subunit sigma-70 [Nonlabens agnitus]
MNAQPDLLIARLQEGSEVAFNRIYERYHKALHGVIFAIVKNEDVAQEILQDVFIKIWKNANSYDKSSGRFFTWTLNIARNASIDYLRSKNHKNSLKNLSTDNFVDVIVSNENLDDQTDGMFIKQWVEKLEPMCVKIIDIIFFKGFTFKDGAKELDMPSGTLKTRHRRCLNNLREMMIN